MTKTEEDKMKQWKLVLVALLAVLLVCTCTSALADEAACTHPDAKLTYDSSVTTYAPSADGTKCLKTVTEYYLCGGCDTKISKVGTVEQAHGTVKTVETPATCTTDGHFTEYCSLCNAKVNEYAGDTKTGHTLGETKTVKAPTCTEKGHYEEYCKTCGVKYNEYDGAALGHTLDKTIETKACDEKTKYEEVCKTCGEIYNTYYSAEKLAHVWKETKVTKVCGEKIKYEDLCKTCGEVYITYYGDVVACEYPAGETKVEKVCGEKAKYTDVCKNCGKANVYYGGVVECVVGKTEEVKVCGEKTVYNEICKNCGEIMNTYEGAVWEHDLKTVKVAATCTEDGSITTACTRCGFVSSTKVLKAFGHAWLWEGAVAPTCTTDGHSKYGYCQNCGIEDPDAPKVVISATGHQFWSAAEVQKDPEGRTTGFYNAPTCLEDGSAYALCKYHSANKNLFQYIVLPAHGHSWTNWTITSKLTCTTDLKAERYCNYGCGTVDKKTFETAYGHNWVIKAGTDATCTEDGLVDRECPICGETEKNVKVPATGHNLVWTTVAQPTAAADGLKELACTVCGYVEDSKVIPYTVMRYSNTATAFGPTTRELVGGSEWARVTPIDLSVEGTFTYPLIASNQYVIGTVTVTIANGTATVNYDTAASQIKVTDEALYLYADKAALAAGTAQEYAFGAPIQIGEDTKVILSVLLTVDYDAVGAGVTGFAADEAQIEAMKAIID